MSEISSVETQLRMMATLAREFDLESVDLYGVRIVLRPRVLTESALPKVVLTPEEQIKKDEEELFWSAGQ